ncbi:OLC1v1019311C1 [Oldenlandia corymbosa var. corymbosa]|uniref:OLC1v1019311C1 n=1 Tax=Oldenlandia corymbosa var. corymbosa TaxID=529605 RepID=A0AAV1EE29_OLDCO|nr:OLC1v1019311C1 [Oldenlandia corymbosa var. corymbosa]
MKQSSPYIVISPKSPPVAMESESDPPQRNKINRQWEGIPSSSSAPNHESDPSLMPDFPDELAVDILSRLPVKSLGKFKCVSKPWLSLISSQGFIKTHLAIASRRDDYEHHRLLIKVYDDPVLGSNVVYSVSSLVYSPTFEASASMMLDIGYRGTPNKSFWAVGSCNGLVCFRTLHNKLFLYNPCLKMYKRLPNRDRDKLRSPGNFGFGYDELNDDYKVVWVFQIFDKPSWDNLYDDGPVTYENGMKVYSLKDDAWHAIEDLKIGGCFLDTGELMQYASGKLHWFVDGGTYVCKIASFDLANETYEEMEPPCDIDGLCDYTLGELGGCLSMFYHYGSNHAEIWVMKDSWVKIVSIPYVDRPSNHRYSCSSRVVCALRNGEVLFVLCSLLLLYNPSTKTFRRYPHIAPIGGVIMYVESLVSLKSMVGND